MTLHFIRENWNSFKNIVLLQFFSKSELKDGTKTFFTRQKFSLFLANLRK